MSQVLRSFVRNKYKIEDNKYVGSKWKFVILRNGQWAAQTITLEDAELAMEAFITKDIASLAQELADQLKRDFIQEKFLIFTDKNSYFIISKDEFWSADLKKFKQE